MKILARSLSILAVCLLAARAWAGSEMEMASTKTYVANTPGAPVALDLFDIGAGYTFESDLNHGGSFGKQDAFQSQFAYAHRFLITGNLYVRGGLEYDRFDFGNTSAPVPVHLQSMAGVIGLDYMHGSDLAAFIWVKPGFYTEEHLGLSSFDAPVTLGRIFVAQEDKLYFFAGAYASFLRGGYPVLPLAGVIWYPAPNWKLLGVLPEPRLVYSPSKQLDLWLGGELAGGSFRTDHDDHILPRKLSGTQVDYEDYRAGLGFNYNPTSAVTVSLAGGCSIERGFKFHRAGENYRTDPAPYVKFEFRAAF